jgi:hypothetical protein
LACSDISSGVSVGLPGALALSIFSTEHAPRPWSPKARASLFAGTGARTFSGLHRSGRLCRADDLLSEIKSARRAPKRGEINVRTMFAVLASILFISNPSHAAKPTRDRVLSQHEAACKAQARKEYPGLRFIKRREYVNRCMGRITPRKDVVPRPPITIRERVM